MERTIGLLLTAIDEAYDKKSWHGTNLRGSLRGLSPEAAAARPEAKRHNIWELVVHAAYWKYVVRRQLTGGDRGGFPLTGSNWFRRDGGTEKEWKADLKLLGDQHKLLRSAVTAVPERELGRQPAGSRYTFEFLIRGIAAHDLYHAGQIQLLKKL